MYNKLKEGHDARSSYQTDEIDIRFLFEKIGNGFRAFFSKVMFVLQVLMRRILLVLLFLIAGLVVGYSLFSMAKPYYSSAMTLVLAEIRNDFVENQLNDLSYMIAEGNITAISSELDINPKAASQIKEMNVFNLDQDRVSQDSVLTGSPFRIVLDLYDNTLFNSLEPALVNYLESNRYFSKQKRIRQREIESMLSKLKQEIISIDSVKTSVAAPRGPVNGFVYGEALDPTSLYRESLTMYERQVKLEAELDRLDNIQVVNGFTPRSRPTGPNLMKYLFVGGVIAFILGLVVALILEIRKTQKLSY